MWGIVLTTVLTACSVRKFVPENEVLFAGSQVELDSAQNAEQPKKLRNTLQDVLSPEPNTKFLGMRPGLYFWYKVNKDSSTGFITRFLNRQFGEKPVYLSDVQEGQMEELLRNRLDNRGFFYSQAQASELVKDSGFATAMNYRILLQKPYRMEKLVVETDSSRAGRQIHDIMKESPIQPGQRFDLNAFELERKRVEEELRKDGYFKFDSNYLIYEADTNRYQKRNFDLFVNFKQGVPEKAKIPYRVEEVNIFANHQSRDTVYRDTTRYQDKNYLQDEVYFKPKYLDPFITMKEGERYSPEHSKSTARRLSSLGSYKYVNINYQETDTTAVDSTGGLRANIYLIPLKKRSIQVELKAITKSNNFTGPNLAVRFLNRNLFKGGENLSTTARAGYEQQIGGNNEQGALSSILLGLDNELVFPRVISPFKINTDFFKYAIPKTKTGLSLEYLDRGGLYSLFSATAKFGYIWQANKFVTHEINPVEINYVNLLQTSPEFEEILEENAFLANSFQQEFISGLLYTFTYNGLVDPQKPHQFFTQVNFETAGNSLSLVAGEGDSGKQEIFGQQFAQFAKADIDFRYHFRFAKDQRIATRFFAGLGMPYGNSDVMPFSRQYFAGGPYSVRAFQIRSLGPGTYSDPQNNDSFFDQTGNLRLEANAEYRFPIINFLKGALFMDAGNIWTTGQNPSTLRGGQFSSNFLNELGIGSGFGLRVDIQSFVIRGDLAFPMHDPALPEGERWGFQWSDPVFNFAIGYPF